MIVKVCGMREPDNIRAIESLGIDFLGFIFYPKSARYVEEVPAYLPAQAKRVGVFVNAAPHFILERVRKYKLDIIQLHGEESPEICLKLHNLFKTELLNIQFIKVFSITEHKDLEQTALYEDICDYFLFDTKCDSYGGSGNTFDWELLQSYQGKTPFLLSGGIGPESKQMLNTFSHPLWAGIDLNSKFETSPAIKDVALLKLFLNKETKTL